MSETVVELEGVALQYDIDADPPGPSVLRGIDLRIEAGESLAIVGPSGCGKTTTLRLIAGFETTDTGTVEVGEQKVAGNGVNLPPEQRRVGMVFQDYALFHHL